MERLDWNYLGGWGWLLPVKLWRFINLRRLVPTNNGVSFDGLAILHLSWQSKPLLKVPRTQLIRLNWNQQESTGTHQESSMNCWNIGLGWIHLSRLTDHWKHVTTFTATGSWYPIHFLTLLYITTKDVPTTTTTCKRQSKIYSQSRSFLFVLHLLNHRGLVTTVASKVL